MLPTGELARPDCPIPGRCDDKLRQGGLRDQPTHLCCIQIADIEPSFSTPRPPSWRPGVGSSRCGVRATGRLSGGQLTDKPGA
jgi:hypothetical protein